MDKYWDKIRQESYDDTFEKTTGLLLQKQNLKKERKHSPMKQFFAHNKYKIAFALFLAFVVAACNYPVTSHNTVGYAFTFTTPSVNKVAVSKSIKDLNWTGNTNINITEKNINGTSIAEFNTVLGGVDEKTAMKCKSDLEKIKEISSVKLFPVTESVTRPVYSALLYSFFRVDVKSSGKSDEEVKSEIERQLKDNGFTNYKIGFDKSGEEKKLTMSLEGNPETGNKSVEVNVDGDGTKEVVKMKTAVGSVDKNMTDEQIKQKVIADNPEGSLKPEDIKIVRDGDNIKIMVEKEDRK
jgi:hypothetical protein